VADAVAVARPAMATSRRGGLIPAFSNSRTAVAASAIAASVKTGASPRPAGLSTSRVSPLRVRPV
jgi:hypothetical protein